MPPSFLGLSLQSWWDPIKNLPIKAYRCQSSQQHDWCGCLVPLLGGAEGVHAMAMVDMGSLGLRPLLTVVPAWTVASYLAGSSSWSLRWSASCPAAQPQNATTKKACSLGLSVVPELYQCGHAGT